MIATPAAVTCVMIANRGGSGRGVWAPPPRDSVTDMGKMPGELSELLETDVTPYAEDDLSPDAHQLHRAIDRLDESHQERVAELELERRQAS
jgi:hypothetical protein